MAADAGVKLLALTDHDTVAGVPEALAAARVKRIDLTPAVELSSVHADAEDLHILGYAIDHADSTLLDALRGLPRGPHPPHPRDGRAPGHRGPRPPVTGPPAPRGRAPANATRSMTRDELFAAYLVPGAPTYVRREPPDGRAGDRHHPRRRRARGLGAPVLGRRGPAARASPASTASRSSIPPTRRSRPARCTPPPARAGY